MKFICPLIVVSDIEKSRYFYESILKQKVKVDFGENVTFHGDFSIHLNTHFESLIDNKEIKTGGNNFELYFEEDNVDDVVTGLKANNIQFVHELREQPWRQKVVRFYDPDQHIIEIGESMEHVAYRLHKEGIPNDEISQITYLPVQIVVDSIAKYSV